MKRIFAAAFCCVMVCSSGYASQMNPGAVVQNENDSTYRSADQPPPPPLKLVPRAMAETNAAQSPSLQQVGGLTQVPREAATIAPSGDTLLGRSLRETALSIMILIFAIIVIILQFAIMVLRKQPWTIVTTRVFGITLVIAAGLLLITAGYTDTQIAPMMGLLGTIVGYLLGKTEPSASDTNSGPQAVGNSQNGA